MRKKLPLFALLTLTLTACAGANFARRDAQGGRLVLQGGYMAGMRDARLRMAEHCQGRFEAREDGDGISFRCHEAREQAPAQVTLAQR